MAVMALWIAPTLDKFKHFLCPGALELIMLGLYSETLKCVFYVHFIFPEGNFPRAVQITIIRERPSVTVSATQPNSQPSVVAIRTKMCACMRLCVCVYMFVYVCGHDTETCLYLLMNLYACALWSILGLYKLKQSTNPLPLEECGLA